MSDISPSMHAEVVIRAGNRCERRIAHCERRRENPCHRNRFPELSRGSSTQDAAGTWTLDGYVAPEVGRNNTPRYTANPNSWNYGPGQSGSIGYHGLYQTARGARLFYTPAGGKHNNMTVRAKFAPNKNSGQGFGSATEQFLDVCIKYDLATNTGYGLRIQRLTTCSLRARSVRMPCM